MSSAAIRLRPGWWEQALTGHERTSRPAWADVVEQALAAAAPPAALPPMDSWTDAFAVPLRPFLAAARDRLADGARRCLPPGHGDPGLIADTFTSALGGKLARIAVRTLVLELNVARASGRLVGADGQRRFEDFVRWQSTPAGLVTLFGKYPVLARLLGTASLLAAEAGLELLARFAADRAAMVEALLGGVDPGSVVAIEPGLGDPHERGRSVAVVSFADGRKVIYKPRGMAAYVLFCEVVDWLNQQVPLAGLRTASVLARPDYGWQEFITHRPLDHPGDAEVFYRREGVLLAALYALNAVDMHAENLIAAGDQPVLVDVETLLHPTLPTPHSAVADPAAQALAASVHRAALLPFTVAGENGLIDSSGMGGDEGAACPEGVLDWDPPATDQMRLIHRTIAFTAAGNRPFCNAEAMEPADHETAVLDGFRHGYDAIAAGRRAFARLVETHGDIEVRIIIRLSRGYARLLDESTHPDLLRAAQDRQRALDVLREASAGQPLWDQLVRHEFADLWVGDIPLLTGRPAARDIWTSTGRLPGLLDRSGLSCALDKIVAMGDVDRRDQEWVISASLATRRPAGGHRSTQASPDPATAVAAPSRLLAAACGLADQIVARGMTGREGSSQGRVNWLGLQFVENTQWMVLPMGASLADGYLGVALFLAQLAELTGVGRYAEVAHRAVSTMSQLLDVLAARPDLLTVVGCGAAEGLGGISYGLARMATLLDDAELRDLATAAVELASAAADLPGPSGWTSGTAGCLAAMTAVQDELESAAAAGLARRCADQLTELVEGTDGWCARDGDPVQPGFAAGPAGVGWALARFGAAGGEPRYRQAAQHAVWRACASGSARRARTSGEERSYGWCRGTAGLLVARTCLAGAVADAELQQAGPALTERPVLSDLSLCHGELGIAEALIVLATIGQDNAGQDSAGQDSAGQDSAGQDSAGQDSAGQNSAGRGSAGQGSAMARIWRRRAGLILGTVNRHALCCGTPGGVPTPGLLNGLAGIGYGLLRLGYAGQVPSVLFLEPTPSAAPPARIRVSRDTERQSRPQ